MKCPQCRSEVSEDSQFCSKCGTRVSSAGSGSSATRTIRTAKLDALAGTVLAGKYEIEGEIGRGGMGIVYRAQDLKLKRPVALKFLPPDFAADPETRERFVIEAQAAAALSHPNICTIYEVGEADELSYIAMEFVEGQSLRQRIKDGPLKAEEATDVAIQVASGLAEAHKKGIVHRDIKSANIMVTPKGQAKIMDFGLAKLRGGTSLTKTQTTLGTVAYMSPEQARGKSVDTRTDIWSLGVVLYEVLSGKRPFQGEHDQSVIYAILHEEPEPLKKSNPGLAPEFENIVGQALAKKPGDRYQTMEELQEDLGAVAEGLKPLRAKGHRRPRRILGIRTAYVYSALAAIMVLLFGLNVGGLRDQILGKAAAPAAIRLAVLPFANLTGDPRQEFFSDGLTQQLSAELGGLNPQALSVIGNTSAARYKGTNAPLDRIGRELRVDYVLEGGAQREGTTVRITAELIKTRDESQVWAETFDRDASSLLTLQSEVAQKVAGALAVKLLPAEKARLARTRPIDPAAYEAYLKGSQYWIKMTQGDVDTAEKYFSLALEKQPDYAAAYTGMASVWGVRSQMGFTPPGEAMPKAKAAALKALELDDNLAEAHYALAGIYGWSDWDMPKADREYRRAVELNSNYPEGLAFYSHYLMIMGRRDEAMTTIERALQLDPFNIQVRACYIVDLLYARRSDDVLAEARKALAMQPDNNPVLQALFQAQANKGMYKESLETLKTYIKVTYQVPGFDDLIDRGFAEGGFPVAIKNAAAALAARAKEHWLLPYDVAVLYVQAGDNEHAMEWVGRAYKERDPNTPYIFPDPAFDPLRSDPRFQALARKMGIPTHKEKSGPVGR